MTTLHVIHHADLTAALADEILALCSDAYEEDFTPSFRLLGGATHVLAMESGRLLAHAAWVRRQLRWGGSRRPLSCAYLEAVATPVALQRRGLGTLVLGAIPPLLKSFDLAALSPSEPEFYARSGWEMWRGELFYAHEGRRIRCEDEQVMIHRLPRTPFGLDVGDELEADWRDGDIW